MRVWGSGTVPLACVPCGGLRAAGLAAEGRSGGAGDLSLLWSASGVRRCPSHGGPYLGAGRQAPFPVFPGRRWCGRGDPAPVPEPALMRAGVVRCVGGGRASLGVLPRAFVRGVRGQALVLAWLPALGAGSRGPLPTCCRRGCAGVGAGHCPFGVHALCRAARRGGGRGVVLGGLTSHRCEGRLVSGAFPLPAPRPSGRAARRRCPCFPGAGGVGMGTQQQPHSMRS